LPSASSMRAPPQRNDFVDGRRETKKIRQAPLGHERTIDSQIARPTNRYSASVLNYYNSNTVSCSSETMASR
jgi:hypothetical protein